MIGQSLRIRAVEYEDLPTLLAWRNDPDAYPFFFEHEPISLVMQKAWFEKLLQRTDEKFWIVDTLEGHLPVGTIGLSRIDWRNRKAELSRVLIAPQYRKKGLGKEVMTVLLRYVFEHLNLNRLSCETFADNQAAIGLYERMGFQKEGVFRQQVFHAGGYRDVVAMAILREEYVGTIRLIT